MHLFTARMWNTEKNVCLGGYINCFIFTTRPWQYSSSLRRALTELDKIFTFFLRTEFVAILFLESEHNIGIILIVKDNQCLQNSIKI